MRILVTGGAGFIGSQFVRGLLTRGTDRVTVLDALTYAGNPANLAPVADRPGYTFVHGDIRDAGTVDEVMPGHDAVVHFAAESHVDRSITGAAPFVSTNVLGTQVLLDAARRHGVARFVHISTDEVYGSIDEGAWTESQPLAPSSPYSASKAGADLLALAYHRTHGMDVVVTRCSNNYGPYQYPEKLIPLFVTRLLEGGRVPLYGDGGNVREWLHVEDHCRGVELVLRKGRPGEIYHIGGGTELTNRELVDRLLAACGADWSRVDHVADRKGHDRRYALCGDKIREELGFVPRIDFETGLAQTVAWYAEHREWWSRHADR
ncbi:MULTISPECIES: dTDP-glucose 4,6-dehydratase [Streptomyces]|jgi:dTDP-glucose 4,6-dehydratase|nr:MULTISPECIES: dTDP-glucose 4,6-dehydratase [unclassified Streptomyces]MDN5385054.1 dTDP-glucose 4,6-dehydratase [Streptomyces sp. LB8]